MDAEADQPPDQRAVDANILEVAADRIFQSPGDRTRVPAMYRLGDQPYDVVAIIGGCAYGGPAGRSD